MPRKASILRHPKITDKKIDLQKYDLTEADINRNHSVKKVWESYQEDFNGVGSKPRMGMNRLMDDILGIYWTMVVQSRVDVSNHSLAQVLKRYSDFRQHLRSRRYI